MSVGQVERTLIESYEVQSREDFIDPRQDLVAEIMLCLFCIELGVRG